MGQFCYLLSVFKTNEHLDRVCTINCRADGRRCGGSLFYVWRNIKVRTLVNPHCWDLTV